MPSLYPVTIYCLYNQCAWEPISSLCEGLTEKGPFCLSPPISSSKELYFSLAYACFVSKANTTSGGASINPVKKELKGHTPQHMWPQPGPGMPSWAALAQIAPGSPCLGAVVCSSSGSALQASHLRSSTQHPSAIWWHLHLHPSLSIMKIQAFVLLQHSSSMNVLTFMCHQETLCYVRILFLWHYLPQLRMSLPASAM